jgi:hypothetical protein
MNINVTVSRSADWIREQSLKQCQNIPATVVVPVDVASLDLGVREAILVIGNGQFGNIFCFPYRDDYNLTPHGPGYGHFGIDVDSDQPTTEEINAAILAGLAQLAAKRIEHERKQTEIAARKKAESERKAAEEKARQAARELLSDEIERLTDQRDTAQTDLETLAAFLAQVPLDALIGTVKRTAANDNAVTELEEKIEAAAPAPHYIFDRD